MARECVLAFAVGFLLQACGPTYGTQEDAGGVFVSQQAAHVLLRRQRRYNSGHLEEVLVGNLERECKEETCSMEEAREVFENEERTMEFWAGYIDGDQCVPSPCQNGAACKDGVNSYVCLCLPHFSGKNCEIDVTKQCSVNNGGCSHFCVMQDEQAVCQCAAGYKLGSDRRSCEPTGAFSCGQANSSSTRSILAPRSAFRDHALQSDPDDDITQIYDYYDVASNDSDAFQLPVTPEVKVRSVRSATSDPPTEGHRETPSLTFYPTLPSIRAKENTDQRIVGGDEAEPGEIPWQATLMTHSESLQRAAPFCGGSLLSELWVITAAHCLVEVNTAKEEFFVRLGEHDVQLHEGPERDHAVAKQYIHHAYNPKRSLYNHDIALLKLAAPVELSPLRRPICVGPMEFTETLLKESASSLVSGWGRLKFGGAQSPKLQKVAVPYVDRTACKRSSQDHITRVMFCAGYWNNQKDSCQGDSGGPHASRYGRTWFLTGIVSWGEKCAQEGKYGIYTRVSRYYAWISRITGIHSAT